MLSLSFTILSGLGSSEVCYTCDPETLLYLIILHGMLLLSTASPSRLSLVLAGVLLVFYAPRASIIQWAPDFYTYTNHPLTLSDMRDATSALLWISFGLLLGCMAGDRLGAVLKRDGPLTILPFEEKIRNLKSFYFLIAFLYIVAKGTAIALILVTGAGLPLPLDLFDINLLRAVKAANFLGFLSIVPIAWFVLRGLHGFEKRLTVLAIGIYVLAALVSFSKVGLISAAIPFLFVYYVSGRTIPPRLLAVAGSVIVIVAFFMYTVMAELRIQLASMYEAGGGISIREAALGVDFSSAVFDFLARVGSAFDVLSAVIKYEVAFHPFLNFFDELLDVANGYGLRIFETDPPLFARLLPAILSGVDYEYLLAAQTGENIGLLGHLYLYWGVIGAAMVSFFVMLLFGFVYRYAKSVFAKILLIQAILFNLPNGSGLIGILLPLFQPLAIVYVLIFIHGLFVTRPGSARVRNAPISG